MARVFSPLAWAGLFCLVGCSSYSSRVREPRSFFESGQYAAAITQFKDLVERHDNDELLYLMDLGLVQHSAGLYSDAIKTFLAADKMAEVKDYTSISREAASYLLSDDTKQYRGEDFEKILINVYLAMDYTLLQQWEDALVEARRVNHKLDLYISEGKMPYEHNAFAKYLSASLFEASGNLDDAFVDYRQFAKWDPSFPYLPGPLLRLADKLHDTQELEEYRHQFPLVKNYRLSAGEGEIILLVEQGRAPVKVPSYQFRLLPVFVRSHYYSDHVILRTDDGREATSYTLFNIEQTAIKELQGKTGAIIAKKIAGVVVKEAAAYGIERATKSPLAGFVASILLNANDHADLRSWSTLPAHLQVARLAVPAGRHNVSLDMVSGYGSDSRGVKRWDAVEVKAGQTVFLSYRTRD